MNKRILQLVVTALFIHLFPFTLRAQFKYEEYKQMYLGWIKIYNYKGALKPVTVGNKTYSKAQLSIIDSFGNWMQASYTPKGSLGDMIKFVSPKKGEHNSNQYNMALPHSYGIRAVSYVYLKKVNDKFIPDNTLGIHWSICANEIPLNYRLIGLCTDKATYFTLPSYKLEHSNEKQDFELFRVPATSSASKYIHTVIPKEGQWQRNNMVLLSKNNVSPFVHVTIGEVLDHVENALSFFMEEELKDIRNNNIGRTQEIMIQSANVKNRYEKGKTTFFIIKDRYKNSRNELAYTKNASLISDLENGYDFLSGKKLDGSNGNIHFLNPVLKLKPEFEKLCKTDKPQWIVIKWWGGEMHDEVYKHMHESIIYNFDFDYVYQFFFEPEKLNDRKYKPLRSPVHDAPVITKEKSSASKNISTDPSVFYFEDFSITPQGQTPVGWSSTLNQLSKKAVVRTPTGETGNWVEINGQTIHVNELGKNLPLNFTMSFDACVRKDFQWGVPGLEFFLTGTRITKYSYEHELMLKIRPGFSGRDGWANMHIKNSVKNHFPSEVAVQGFSNDKPLNKVRVVITKKGTQLTIWANNLKIFDIVDAMPASTAYSHFYFINSRAGWPVEEFYISNFTIKKEE